MSCICHRPLSRSLFTLVLLATAAAGRALMAGGVQLESLLESDPSLVIPVSIHRLDPAMKALWLSALESPETDLQRMAAETIARSREVNNSDLSEAIPLLQRILHQKSSHPAARFSAARALIALDSRDSAEKLFEASKSYGADLRQLIEPVLADWNYEPARSIWMSRLGEATPRRRDLMLALRCLGIVREPKALEQLLSMTKNLRGDPDIRIQAAIAAGQVSPAGLEAQAAQLLESPRTPTSLNQLCAIQLLSQHHSASANQLLLTLASDPESLVASTAMHQLHNTDPELLIPLAESALKHIDARIRVEGVHSCIQYPTPEKTLALGRLLTDPDPAIRTSVRTGLSKLFTHAELKDSITQVVLEHLRSDGWKGQEQAAILSGEIDLKQAATRLGELLESPRTEVNLAAAWAIRKLAVKDTIPAILEFSRRQTEQRKSGAEPGVDEQVAYLFEALGVMEATEAIPLLKEYIPKLQSMGVRSRSAAIWAIGKIQSNMLDPEIEEALSDRILDFEDKPAENAMVKQMCAISLARMKAVGQAATMRDLAVNVPISIELGVALRWAVKELTGEELPPPQPLPLPAEDWFMTPIH